MKSSLLLFLLVPLILACIFAPMGCSSGPNRVATSTSADQIVDIESSDALASETTSTTFTDLAQPTQLIQGYDASNVADVAHFDVTTSLSCTPLSFDADEIANLYSKLMTTTAPNPCAMVYPEVEATARNGVIYTDAASYNSAPYSLTAEEIILLYDEVEATARAGVVSSSNTGMCIASGIDEVSGHYMMDIAPATNHRYDDLGAGGGIVAVARNGCNDDLFAGSIWEFHDTIFDVNADVSSSGHAKTAMNLRI